MLKGYCIRVLLIPVFTILAFAASAQNIKVSEPLVIRNDYGYELIGRLRDRILLLRDKNEGFEIQAYDNQMRPSWNRELEEFDRKNTTLLASSSGDDDFNLIYTVRKRGISYLRVSQYNPGAALKDSIALRTYNERSFLPPDLHVLRSENRKVMAVYNAPKPRMLEIICFRLDTLKVLWEQTIEFEQDFQESQLKSLLLSDAGQVHLVSEFNNRKGKIEDHTIQVSSILGAGKVVISKAGLPDFLVHSVNFTFDNINKRVLGAGLGSEKTRERADGAFFVSVKPGDSVRVKPLYTPFDEQFISILRRKDVETTKGIDDGDVVHLIPREDGGGIMIVERNHEVMRGTGGTGRGLLRDGNTARSIIDYYFDDMFVINFQPDGAVQWKTVLHKKQYSQDDDATFSSFFLMRAHDRLHFLFNDEVKYENSCSEYIVTPVGDFDRNTLLNTAQKNLRLRFRDALQLNASECLIPSEFRNRLRLVLVRV